MTKNSSPLCVNSDVTDPLNLLEVCCFGQCNISISDVNKVLKNAYTVEPSLWMLLTPDIPKKRQRSPC